MKNIIPIVFCLLIACTFCKRNKKANNQSTNQQNQITDDHITTLNENGTTIKSRFTLSEIYTRQECSTNSFGYYLQNFPLKPHSSDVLLYNGKKKIRNVHVAVLDIDVGNKNLQQCADAIMRLRGEYLFENKFYDDIHFNLTNGFCVDYSKWIKGYRVKVTGNKTEWIKLGQASNIYSDFRKYMEFIFTYAGTLSLSQELITVSISDLKIGDIFIQGGSPGHAVIIVDLATHKTNGKKIFLLAQSYMPAQDIHILKNPNNKNLSPWYEEAFENKLYTPEWTFESTDLMRFKPSNNQ